VKWRRIEKGEYGEELLYQHCVLNVLFNFVMMITGLGLGPAGISSHKPNFS